MRIYPTKSSGQVGNEKMGRPPARRERINGVNGRYKGVRMRKWGKWVAEVRQPNSRDRIWLGSYDTAEEAGRAYDAAVFCLRGPTAMLNFPWDPPQIPSADELNPVQIQAAASRHARKESQEANTSTPQEVAGTTSSELNNRVIDSMNSTTELNDPAINSTICGDSYSVRRGGGGGEGVDNLVAGGTFYETPRVWSF